METGYDFLIAFREDEQIYKLVTESEILKGDYKPRTRRGTAKRISSSLSIAYRHFWKSLEGANLRFLIAEKYGVNLSDTRVRGSVKDALLIYLWEVMRK